MFPDARKFLGEKRLKSWEPNFRCASRNSRKIRLASLSQSNGGLLGRQVTH